MYLFTAMLCVILLHFFLLLPGEGRKDEEGKVNKPNVTVGATVLYSKYSGTEFEVGAA